MVEQFRKLAERLATDGFPQAALRTSELSTELKREGLISDTLDTKPQVNVNGDLLKPEKVFNHPSFTFYPERGFVIVDGKETRLNQRESGVLELLMKNPNRFLSSEIIMQSVWGSGYEDSVVKSSMSGLRKKLEPAKKSSKFVHITSSRGLGYRLVDPLQDLRLKLSPEKVFNHSGFTFYPERSMVIVDGKKIHLTRTENWILNLLAKNLNRVLSQESIFSNVSSSEHTEIRTLNSHIKNLRLKIEPNSKREKGFVYLLSIYGLGYKLVDPGKSENGES